MNTTTHRISFAGRLGHWLGRGWRAYVRGERRASAWLVSQGVPAAGAAIALWVVKLGVLAIFVSAAFWLALLLVFAVSAAWAARNADWDTPQSELRTGPLGFGMYHPDGSRIDPHDPNAEA
jgi:hypothetical protein